ncbi:MAG: SHOCT domain-containing protein, partial [Candidatus Enteromonas sp.]|nr:SHOCT domain-containing protein [Candidatus Enteromonas sp.]
CVFMIIPIGVTFILQITSSGENSSSAFFMALLTLGQLILAIMYLASKDEECGTDVSLDGKPDPVAELKRLESYLESGYISQEEYEQARQKYVDKL